MELPDGFLPGPAFGRPPRASPVGVGVIVKPSLGLTPAEVGEVARAAVAGGATFIKDDEILGDPDWCPLDERVRAVAKALEPGVVYCANVTGPGVTLVERARRVGRPGRHRASWSTPSPRGSTPSGRCARPTWACPSWPTGRAAGR